MVSNHHSIDQPDVILRYLTNANLVKFDTVKLPPILNALQTTNNGQKLVLEVAVRTLGFSTNGL